MSDTHRDSLVFNRNEPYHYFILQSPDGSTETVRANSLHAAFLITAHRVAHNPKLTLINVGRVSRPIT